MLSWLHPWRPMTAIHIIIELQQNKTNQQMQNEFFDRVQQAFLTEILYKLRIQRHFFSKTEQNKCDFYK